LKSYKVQFGNSFSHSVKKLEKRYPHVKDDIHIAIGLLAKRPKSGAIIRGSSGLRKLRVRNSDIKRGKRAGYRLIYCVKDLPEPKIFILLLYSKSDKANATQEELKELLSELDEIIGDNARHS